MIMNLQIGKPRDFSDIRCIVRLALLSNDSPIPRFRRSQDQTMRVADLAVLSRDQVVTSL
jgi:hypothetical protein